MRGAAGTFASLGNGDIGIRVRREMASELGLQDSGITWHVMRDNIAEITNFLALIGGSLGKISTEIMIMSSNEFNEVSEPFQDHRGASSTMSQKQNPISSEVVLAASKILRSNADLVLDAMICDFARASGPWHLEWVAIPESFVIVCGALHQTNFALYGLVVNVDSMLTNLNSTKGLVVGKAIMMALVGFVGRQVAHDIVYDACKSSIETGKSLSEILQSRPDFKAHLEDEKICELCDPSKYLGACRIMVNDVVGM